MLEIIAIIFLTKKIGRLAEQKGLKPGPWKVYTVLAWIGSELVGIVIGFLIFGQSSVGPAILLGYTCAIASFFILKANLNKRPDNFEDDINKIGVRDLYP